MPDDEGERGPDVEGEETAETDAASALLMTERKAAKSRQWECAGCGNERGEKRAYIPEEKERNSGARRDGTG